MDVRLHVSTASGPPHAVKCITVTGGQIEISDLALQNAYQ
jgi:hypothetical protein